ncbi:class I SAM-dependent methyltransferase [Paenibacillus sp. JDR-2]|uniref:class I SAM-dependent methyltransferase n=1 Tax=Paenibacillus sp. (strain JDR-2) TaxID=324057 RepID=UPI0001666838|nr:class I SAM-dependent methyltransferase [Paenibacillus sp. JDR-2]ACS99827.1 Methyltransferase type 11 [Paenibacillus sp. JDR-2]
MEQEDRNQKDKVVEQFSRSRSEYVSSEAHARGDDLDLLLTWLQPESHHKALDIATGGGHVAKKLSSFVNTVFAADLTRPMLETARQFIQPDRENVEFVVSDAENLPFLDQTFDIVTCRIAAHHFPNPEQFVREAARVLKQGGKFLLIDNVVPEDKSIDTYVNQIELLRDESHYRCHSVSEWERWLLGAGLKISNNRIRKKSFDYPKWVRRTTRSEDQVKEVATFILNGGGDAQEYIGLKLEGGEIQSITIDEWMVLAVLE